jgi:MGT family glycosyltransferase
MTTDNVLVRPRIPQLDVLDHMDAVVSHGGHNTVCESLARGLPLVLAPIRDDQPIVTDQVVRAGAGLRVKFGRVSPEELADTLHRVLTEPSFRQAAASIRASFVQAGGAKSAADAVEDLLTVVPVP